MNGNMNPILASPLVLPLLMIGVVYFMMIRPQQKQQRELGQMQKGLKKNDEVVTTGGVHGTVVNVKDTVVTLRVDDNVRIDVDKSAVARRVREG